MSQRNSGYARVERDAYETPEWVTLALRPHLSDIKSVREPAAGSGKMVRALELMGLDVSATDIAAGNDFFNTVFVNVDAIITNPPYECAQEFIEHALEMKNRWVMMLLRTDFDHAKSRQHLFGGCPQFAKKLVLTKRIQWFEHSTSAPSFNHAWFIWDWKHSGPPVLAYGPDDTLI